METLALGNFEIRALTTPETLRLEWSGEADDREPSKTVRPYLDQAASEASASGQKLVVDLTRLQFMNSASIGLVMSFVKSLQDSSAHVDLLYDTKIAWQILSCRCSKTIFGRAANVRVLDAAEDALPTSSRR